MSQIQNDHKKNKHELLQANTIISQLRSKIDGLEATQQNILQAHADQRRETESHANTIKKYKQLLEEQISKNQIAQKQLRIQEHKTASTTEINAIYIDKITSLKQTLNKTAISKNKLLD